MNAIKRLENLREEFLANANRCHAKAAVWEAAATLVDDQIAAIKGEDDEVHAEYEHIPTIPFEGPVKGFSKSDPAPSGTVALEYKFGVGDVIKPGFASIPTRVKAVTPTHYMLEFDYGDGFGAEDSYRIEWVEDKFTLVRRAGEGEKQAEKDEPLKVGDSVEAAVPGSMPHLHLPATIEHLPDSEFAWVRNADNHLGLVLLSSLRRVSPPAPEKPARPAYKAGQVWRNKEGDLLTLISQHLGLGGWYWTDHNGAKGFSYFPQMDRHWTFVSDAPEAAPEKPKENPLSPSTVQGCKFRRGDVIELDGQQWKIDHLGFMKYELHRPGHVTIVDSVTADQKAVLVRPGYRVGQVWKNRNGIPITLVKYRWSQSNHQLEWKGQDPQGLTLWFFESDLDHWTFVSEAAQ